MKRLLLFLVTVLAVQDKNAFRNYIETYVKAIGDGKEIQELVKCFLETEKNLDKTKKAVEIIRHMDPKDLKEGAVYFKEATGDLAKMMRWCNDNYKNLKQLDERVKLFTEQMIIEKLEEKMGVHFHLATTAYLAFNEKRYDEAGANVGEMVRLVFLDINQDHPMKEFTIGFSGSIEEMKDLLPLLKCAKADDDVFAVFNEACKYILKTSHTDLIVGSQLLLNTARKFLTMLLPCVSGYDRYNLLTQKVKSAEARELMQKMTRQLGVYCQLAQESIDAFKSKGYRLAGSRIGLIFDKLFLE